MSRVNKERVAGLILAAGMGKRMRSPLPKVLHPVAGKPMVDWVMGALLGARVDDLCMVLGGEVSAFENILAAHEAEHRLSVCLQHDRRGTGDAVASAASAFLEAQSVHYCNGTLLRGSPSPAGMVLICAGDTPNIRSETLRSFIDAAIAQRAELAVIGMRHPAPTGYGRLIYGPNLEFERIVEERDATDAERQIQLCNSGVILARVPVLFSLLNQLVPNNDQGEYYLTDCFALGRKSGARIYVHETDEWQEFQGVNTPEQLADLERLMLS